MAHRRKRYFRKGMKMDGVKGGKGEQIPENLVCITFLFRGN